jgi:hypothetical protein
MVAQKTDKPVASTRARVGRPPKGLEFRWIEPFLEALALCGNIGGACEMSRVRVSRQVVRERRKADPEFDQRVLDAYEDHADGIRQKMNRRSEESDRVLIEQARAYCPEYRNSAQVQVNVSQYQRMDVELSKLDEQSLQDATAAYLEAIREPSEN